MPEFLFETFFILLFFLLVVLDLLLIARSISRLVGKAYPPVPAASIGFGVWIVLFPLFLVAAFTLFPNTPGQPVSDLLILEQVGGSLALAGAAVFLLAKLLPRRVHRTGPQPRRWTEWWITQIFNRCAPWIAGALVLFGLAAFYWLPGKSTGWHIIRIALFVFGFQKLLAYARKLEKQPTASQLVAQDPRPPTLYIRTFQFENDYFTYGQKDAIAKYIPDQITLTSPAFMQLNIEQYLGPCLSEHIGPFIGLGNPRDYTRIPGAARDYLTDGSWKDIFLRYAQQSSAILMQPTASDHLRWELNQIVANGWQTKLFILQRPLPKSRGKLTAYLFRAIAWASYSKRPTWEEFTRWMALSTLKLPATDPGPGTVLSFDPQGNSVQLTTGANEPEEFVTPLHSWLQLRQRNPSPPAHKNVISRVAPQTRLNLDKIE